MGIQNLYTMRQLLGIAKRHNCDLRRGKGNHIVVRLPNGTMTVLIDDGRHSRSTAQQVKKFRRAGLLS